MPDSTANSSLRFAIMCGESGLSDVAHKCVELITKDRLAEPVLLIVDLSKSTRSSMAVKIRKGLRLNGNLWALQSKFFPVRQIQAYQRSALPDQCFYGVDRLRCQPTRKGTWSYHFSAKEVSAIRGYQLDFILKFTPFIIRGDVLTAARYGIWSYHHDDEEKYRGGPPAFWEILKGDPVTAAVLQRLTDRLDGGVVLKHCYVPTDGRSYRRNLQQIQASSAHMVRWVCLDIKAGRADYLLAPPSATRAPIRRAPNDLQMLCFWWRLARNWVSYRLANQRIDEWNVAVINAPQAAFLDPEFKAGFEWTNYREPGQMVADPFLVPTSEGLRILVEEFNWATEKGRICEIRRVNGETGGLGLITPVIDEGIHMSYPFTFRHDGVTYAIPETGVTRNVNLYRLEEESGAWIRLTTLIENIDAVDATVVELNGTWWLMHSGSKEFGPWSLYIWHAPSLLGPWQPHIANPVKTDVGSSRPAGNLFWHEGILYRPAQDGRLSYGGALAINRIDELTPERFSESIVRRILPDPEGPYPDGLHTLSGFGGVSVVDGNRHRWPPLLLARRWLAKRLGLAPPGFRYARMSQARLLPMV